MSKRNRRRQIIAELSRLSRNGWEDAKPGDYLALEKELRASLAERSGS